MFTLCNLIIFLGFCYIAEAVKGDVDVLLNGVGDKSTIEEVKHILEMVFVFSLSRNTLLYVIFSY